jgi:hypothetical protein
MNILESETQQTYGSSAGASFDSDSAGLHFCSMFQQRMALDIEINLQLDKAYLIKLYSFFSVCIGIF